ncbi:MAG: hypothetical protein HKN09_04885, partial [Saprospiraceae bacterium]|nr:hypothetical protein [Saprospiraceae bacterium]
LEEGSYTISIRETNSPDCETTAQFEIEGVEPPTITDIIVTPISDCNNEDAIIEILSDDVDIVYALNDINQNSPNSTFTDLSPGVYTAYIQNAFNADCRDSIIISISDLQYPEINSIEVLDESDCKARDGYVMIEATGIQLEYSIDNGVSWQESSVFNMLEPGMYEIWVREQRYISCLNQTDIIINEAECPCPTIELDYALENIVCNYILNGSITINEVVGLADPEAYQVLWSTGDLANSIVDLSEGWYYCTVSYDTDCIYLDSFEITTLPPITFDLLTYDSDCEDSNNGSIEITNVEGGSGVYFYGIEDSDVQSESGFYNLSPGMYTMLVQDEYDCAYYDSFNIDYSDPPGWQLAQGLEIEYGDSVYLNPLIDISSIDSFTWSPNAYILNPESLEALVAPTDDIEYCLTIYFGACQDVKCIDLKIKDEQTGIYLANTFNPNSIGNNRYFYPQSNLTSNQIIDALRIYDRWGNLVFVNEDFQINDEAAGWNGVVHNQNATQGVFVYYLEYVKNGTVEQIVGTLTLVR